MDEFINSLHLNKKVSYYMKKVDYKYFTKDPYIDRPKFIYKNMTISAPHMHGLALKELKPWKYIKSDNCTILDVGCGSGYLTAVFSLIGCKVYGIDNKKEIIDIAYNNINKFDSSLLKNNKIELAVCNAWLGFSNITFDIIHIGACANELPYKLIKQLKINGRMFIPLMIDNIQKAYIIKRKSKFKYTKKYIADVAFVHLEK